MKIAEVAGEEPEPSGAEMLRGASSCTWWCGAFEANFYNREILQKVREVATVGVGVLCLWQ